MFVYAATLYPGGSQANPDSVGYDWINNYWCNLMNPVAMNGMINPAQPIAILGNITLTMTISFFFYSYGQSPYARGYWKIIIPWAGFVSMIMAGFLFTSYHDVVSVISGFFGVIALTGVFSGLIQAGSRLLLYSGFIVLAFIAINNLIYFSGFGIRILPVLQKVTLLIIFIWVLKVHWAK
ncbi:MAG: hypothetical protein ABIR66_03125 [Saprospiraceae bacterium]